MLVVACHAHYFYRNRRLDIGYFLSHLFAAHLADKHSQPFFWQQGEHSHLGKHRGAALGLKVGILVLHDTGIFRLYFFHDIISPCVGGKIAVEEYPLQYIARLIEVVGECGLAEIIGHCLIDGNLLKFALKHVVQHLGYLVDDLVLGVDHSIVAKEVAEGIPDEQPDGVGLIHIELAFRLIEGVGAPVELLVLPHEGPPHTRVGDDVLKVHHYARDDGFQCVGRENHLR